MSIDFSALPTPCYVLDEALLRQNLETLASIQARTGCHILLAQKAFSMFAVYPLIGTYLCGTAASGLFEAKLGAEYMGGETHIFSPAYQDSEFDEILSLCDHIIFNSFAQWQKFQPRVAAANRAVSCGLRINPRYSTQPPEHAIYDPCAAGSRLGIPLDRFQPKQLNGISGLHFHTLCEQNADALWETLMAVDKQFGACLRQMDWLNFGGGHHITRPDYDIETLVRAITFAQETYGVTVYLEPGEAVVLNTGFLVSSVLECIDAETPIAILDTSAACHMPDVLEMPYRPEILGASKPGEKPYTFSLGGPTCLAGDVIGEYAFDQPLRPSDRLVFCDMAHYTMVKNNTFNGMRLPSIILWHENGQPETLRTFGYEDFKMRLS